MKILAVLFCLVMLQRAYAASFSADSASGKSKADDELATKSTTSRETKATKATTTERVDDDDKTTTTKPTTTKEIDTTDDTTTTAPGTTTTTTSSNCQACDNDAVVEIDLKTDGGSLNTAVAGIVDGITVTSYTDPGTTNPCDARALVTVDFLRLCHNFCFDGCIRGTNCSQRILEVNLEYSGTQTGWLFNVGDSSTNNGWGGDGTTQTNDAEVYCLNGTVSVHSSDKCNSTVLDSLPGACNASVAQSTIRISNEFVHYNTNNGVSYNRCQRDCLYALNGQSDSEGPVNERIFIGLNRVVSASSRYGYGICKATLRWICPGCD